MHQIHQVQSMIQKVILLSYVLSSKGVVTDRDLFFLIALMELINSGVFRSALINKRRCLPISVKGE